MEYVLGMVLFRRKTRLLDDVALIDTIEATRNIVVQRPTKASLFVRRVHDGRLGFFC